MEPIRFTSQCYLAGDRPIYLLSGEFHYFRVPRTDWRERMRLFKAAGGNCLATYIPWLIHEPVEGQFRFSGEDWLALEDFLQTAQAEGLYVIARPGPYQYSELIYHGLPGWLIKNYPELLAQTAAGEPVGYASVSYTHPLFKEKVRAWFSAVCPILARYTVSRGGPIAFTQIDNELVGIHEWFGSLDYHPVSMGIGQVNGEYPMFLKGQYGTIDSLNRAYQSTYQTFTQVRPVINEPLTGQPPAAAAEAAKAAVRRKRDYFNFYLSTISAYAQFLVDLLRQNGIDTPILHNSGNPNMNAYFEQTIDRLNPPNEPQFLLGSDHYYNLDQSWPQNNPTPQYGARAFISLEMLRLLGFPPSVLELPGGSASDWPPITPADALTCYFTNLAFGMKGANYYIFTGGPNPPGVGNTTDLYDYGASIGAHGEIRPLYEAQTTFGAFLQNHPDWLTARRLCDFRLGMDLEYARSEQYWSERGLGLFTSPDAWQFLRRGLVTTALCAGLSPEFINLADDLWCDDTATPLVVASSSSMGADRQRRLVQFINHGGRLLIGPVLPTLDENLEPCTILSDYLGSPRQTANTAGLARPRIGAVVNVNGQIYPFETLPPGAEVMGVDEFTQLPIAAALTATGGGQVILLGLNWTQAMREHEQMLRQVLARLGVKPIVQCDNPNVWVTAYQSTRRLTVFVMNLFTTPLTCTIHINLPGGEPRQLGPLTVDPMTVMPLDID